MADSPDKNETIVQCLLKCWIKAVNDCEGKAAGPRLESVFAEGPIDVKDEFSGRVITATSVSEYRAKWQAALSDIAELTFILTGEPDLKITGEEAIIDFRLTADAIRADGMPLEPRPAWKGHHQWRRIDNEWRIVKERLIDMSPSPALP